MSGNKESKTMTDEKKYERLTKKYGIGRFVKSDCITCKQHKDDITGCDFCGGEEMCNKWCCGVLYNRLAELEDKIENGTLIELPCKVGSKVYEVVITPNYNFISEEVIGDIWIKEDGVFARTGLYTTDYFEFEEFGKTVFLTKAEAEKKLKELQNG